MVEDLYEEIGTLDRFAIIDHAGIDLHYVDFGANPLGQYIKLFNNPTILLNKSIENSPQEYFVASHELHHALEHEEIAS
ncbi:ImmA/IrrE family metallo-endopeptidase [Alkalibacterium putridalgicola]|uniref:ImmA/IrrE family metallo-endopeptidase n=1 Tax=Alkalibacterium putridalgicola TaxID=426703 RepID=UPI0034CE6E05